MGKLDGKVVLVTGGSEGIGLATAERFIQEGAAHVYITGRRQEALDKAVKQIGSKNITTVQADGSNLGDIDKLIDIIKQGHHRLDVLFANAGRGEYLKLDSVTEEHYEKTFNLNVKGVLFTVQKALPIFRDGGSIILNGSIGGSKGKEGMSIYSATKAAIRSFARTWSVDLKERKIRVNTLSPGPIMTQLLQSVGENEEANKNFLAKEKAETVLNRIGEPSEVASAAIFLASDDSSYVTGIELFVDGGSAQI